MHTENVLGTDEERDFSVLKLGLAKRAVAARARAASALMRAHQLAERRRELVLARGETTFASTLVQAQLAAEHVAEARLAADEARRFALAACEASARVHDRVAGLYERLARSGTGDAERNRTSARAHREAAAFDRELAGTPAGEPEELV